MNWIYLQSTGALSRNGYLHAHGFSGRGTGRNFAELETLASIGAIPAGDYRIVATSTEPGRFALQPYGHLARNRSGLHLSAPDPTHPATVAAGALVLPRRMLAVIASSGIRFLTVQGGGTLPPDEA